MIGRAQRLWMEVWLPAVLVAIWWFGSLSSTSIYFPPLKDILNSFRSMWLFSLVGSQAVPSLVHLCEGFIIASISGIALGLLFGVASRWYDVFAPVFEFARATPGIAILPIALLLFGPGTPMKVFVIAFGAFWPVFLNTIDGVRGVDPVVLDTARAFNLSARHRVIRVLLPAASPQILAGARISVSLSVVLIVASEYLASTSGIGYVELQSARTFDITDMWSALILLGIIGYVVNVAYRLLEHRLLAWHRGLRGTDA